VVREIVRAGEMSGREYVTGGNVLHWSRVYPRSGADSVRHPRLYCAFIFYSHVLRLGLKESRLLIRKTTNVFFSNGKPGIFDHDEFELSVVKGLRQ